MTGTIALFLGISASAQTNGIPLFQFAVFYNSLLEFTWCPPMTINGRVHANGDMYSGSAWQLAFNDQVTLTGNLSSPSWGGYNASQYTKPATFFAPTVTNASALTLNTGLPNTATVLREIINPPPDGEDSDSPIGQQRYFNKAKVVVVVTDSNIVATVKSSPTDPSPGVISAAYYPTNNHWTNYASITNAFPFLNRTNYWPTNPVPVIDQRENVTLKLTDINLSIFKDWLITNAILNSKFAHVGGVYPTSTDAPNILFVADNRTCSPTQLAAVRLNHCQIIPTNLFVFNGSNTASGFTVATPNPLYIWGHFNVPNAAYVGSTNTTAAGAYPASLIADAVTILSDNWRDSQSGTLPSSRTPTATTINAAIAAGIVYSTGPSDTTFSGGIQNLPRLLENWTASITLTMNGSLVNLFPSGRATRQYQKPGVYYNAPTRQFYFDPNFLLPRKLPPGTPMVGPTNIYLPAILRQPVSQAAMAASNADFRVSASGTPPLNYQWLLNGVPVVGGTNSSLTVPHVQTNDAGRYTVVVSNLGGSITSDPADLFVVNAPDFCWARALTNSTSGSGRSSVTDLALDATGNVLAAGVFYGPMMDLGGIILSNPGAPLFDSANFFCKYDSSGNLLWGRVAGGRVAGGDVSSWGPHIQADSSGNMYLAGQFSRAVSLGSNTLVCVGSQNVFLAKLDAQGEIMWARQIVAESTNIYMSSFGLAVAADDSVFLAAPFTGVADFGSTAVTNGTGLLAKWNSEGNLQWAKEAFPANAIRIGASGAVSLASASNVLAKYDATGSLSWARPFPQGLSLALDVQENIYATGYGLGTFDGFTLTNSAGFPDAFVSKCDPTGHVLWMQQVGGKHFQQGWSIALDEYSNVYFASASADLNFEDSIQFGPTTLNHIMGFAAKYDPAGNPLWARALQNSGNFHSEIFAIAIRKSHQIFVGGAFNGTAGAGPLTLWHTTANAQREAFVAALDGSEPAATPLIGSQPQNLLVCAGGLAAFSVSAPSGIPLGYQWFFNQTNAVGSATNASLVLSNVQTADAGSYSVIVTNRYGAATSTLAQLFVAIPPTLDPPLSNLVSLAGQTATFSCTPAGTSPLALRWQFNGSDVAGATGTSLVLTNVASDQAGTYSVIVSNIAGSLTNSATLSVYPTAAATLSLAPAFSPDHFQFTVTGVSGFNYVIETSTNFLDWEPLLTNKSPFTLTDDQATNLPARFYRSVYAP